MRKKITCPGCNGGFIPTMDALSIGKASCPACGTSIPISNAQAMDVLSDSYRARGQFALGASVLLDAKPAGEEFEIQWMPPGRQTPTASVEGDAREMDFTVTPQHALAFDGMLQRLRALAADGKGDLPFIDFNHEDGAASGRPTQMFWGGEDPKKGGIRIKGRWTASGKAAVTGDAPEFTRFSPEWYFDDDGQPLAIGVNLGGLVNRAAFKTIASVTAGAATNKQKKDMTKEEMQAVLTEALKPLNTEIAALKAQAKGTETAPGTLDEAALTKAIAKAIEPVTTKITNMESSLETGRKAQAKAAVKVHVDRGAIAPEEKMPDGKLMTEYYEEMYLAQAGNTEALLKKLPGRNLGRVILGAGGNNTATAGSAEFSEAENRAMAGVKKMRESNKALASDAAALEAYLQTPEGNAIYGEILAGRSNKRRDVQIAR